MVKTADMDTKYLRQRRGRWLVQVAVPRDLRATIGKAVIERYLRTSSLAEAKRRRHAVVAEILEMFDRARDRQSISYDEMDAVAEVELRKAYDHMAGDFLQVRPKLPEWARAMEGADYATDTINPILGEKTQAYAT